MLVCVVNILYIDCGILRIVAKLRTAICYKECLYVCVCVYVCVFAQINTSGITPLSVSPLALRDRESRPTARHMSGINNRYLFGRRKKTL